MGRVHLSYAALTILLLTVGLLNHHNQPQNRLHRALTTLKKTPIHVDPHEQDALKLDQTATNPKGFSNPVPSVIPESHRLLRELGEKQGSSHQAYEHLLDLNYESISATILKSVSSAFGASLVDSSSRRLDGDSGDSDGTLTWGNTEQLKIHVNWGNFDQSTAKPHTTCFTVGDWSFTGANNPGNTPISPSDTPTEYPICDFDNYDVFTSENTACWYLCQARDVVNTERFNFLKANVETAAAKLEEIYRIPKMSEPLKFEYGSMANFANNALGWAELSNVCSVSTFGYCDTLLPAEFCDTGVPDGGNIVLNMMYKPYMWGGGLGGPCETDQHGRPISIGFWTHLSLKETITNLAASGLSESQRNKWLVGFSTHEINHGLGFNLGAFNAAGVVEKHDVYSQPGGLGEKEDSLWHFKKNTRLSMLAQVHFDCWDDDAWDGVPLIGAIEGGRDSHQNSFLFLEDTESYGPQSFELNTPFTLAALEDIGHYLANYTYSEYPNWGAYQGCDFITTRCRTRSSTLSYSVVSDNDECDRDFDLSSAAKFDKCANPSCGSKSACHPECVVLSADNVDEYKELRPVMNGTDAYLGSPRASGLLDQFNDFLNSELFQLILPVVAWVITWIFLYIARKMCCSTEKGMISFSHIVSGIFLVCGLGLIGVAGYMFYFRSLFEDVFNMAGIVAVGVLGFFIACQAWMQWLAATKTNKFMYKVTSSISCFMIVIQFVILMWIVLYNYALDEVQNEASGGGKWDQHFFGSFMKPVESYLCESYRNCCKDPMLSEGDVCTTAHEGTVSTLIDDQTDPSRDAFCEFVSGMKSADIAAARGISQAGCDVLSDAVMGFDRDSCQAEFCASGVSGYEDFITLMVSAFRRNFNIIAGIFFVLLIIQLEQMKILKDLYFGHKFEEEEDERRVEKGRRASAKQAQREQEWEENQIREAKAESLAMQQMERGGGNNQL
ncbi:hypothetical protein TL16_g02011 [Triparma laevis f. inornata]|uniref:Uncharacterized protein n=1 Tax=Triparma laevis f. inornata TaxID=1714386 RepID=A0A9W6ZJU9_9STRA|nr:hypothetical protein TL16_g02011 [Triparma laevis f. inornata]